MKKEVQKHWDIRPIKKIPALYRAVVGERSNGKTYGVLLDCIKDFWETGAQFAYVRRWRDDLKGGLMQDLFSAITNNEEITKVTNGEYNGIKYKFGKFYLYATDGTDSVTMEEPFCHTFAISAMEHTKSISYPKIKHIVFDEFISRTSYIPDEFSLFMNLLSTIIRDRDDVDIWLLGNTVSKECPYFREMGIKHIYQQQEGTIDTYSYSKNGSEMLIAVERTKNLAAKKSDKYFIFDNPKMEMITGGAWELAVYPHLFEKYIPKQIVYMFFVKYRDTTLQCEVIEGKRGFFIYVHKKTTELKDKPDDLIYSTEMRSANNFRLDITRPVFTIERKINQLIANEKICYQDNEIGEVFNDYLKWCKSHTVIRR